MKSLTKAEEEIMQIVWRLGPCTVSQIIEDMGEPKPPHSSISSIVRILEKKAFVDHKAYGRTYEYFPKVSKEEYSKRTINQLVTDYFEGSMNRLVSFLVKQKNVNPDELSELLKDLEDKTE
ncbi:MAG: BlaI/MecI/CopY family transcriptional regulator [Saprospiraceae bacterium]